MPSNRSVSGLKEARFARLIRDRPRTLPTAYALAALPLLAAVVALAGWPDALRPSRWIVAGGGALPLLILVGYRVWKGRRTSASGTWDGSTHDGLEDPITGLPSEGFVRTFFDTQFAAAERGQSLAIALLEIDRPHEEGTRGRHRRETRRLLRAVGSVLHENVREMNVAGRVDETRFLAVLPHEATSGASVFAHRLIRDLANLGGRLGRPITASAGVAAYEDTMDDSTDLLARARDALERALELGGDTVILFGDDAYRVGPVQPHFAAREGATPRPVDYAE